MPGDLPLSTAPATVASELSDRAQCVPGVTSCVVPSLRCAVAFKAAAPPTLMLVGVAVTVRELRVAVDGLAHPAVKIDRAQMSLEQISRAVGKRIDCLV